ncbi:Uncharacterised protein [Salmonella enterica subsp. arizonae]|uniref:Uncharacterized protein n=1 Tax=Salmonella enterica subsp. arizonae TaxID=59203 RepID=A0A379T8A2_SALER|nr:Uncharacterised protein [Salmonella enterica subsp. arizonae]
MLKENTSSSTASLMVTPPSLPKGGGTLSGMGEALGQAGPGGHGVNDITSTRKRGSWFCAFIIIDLQQLCWK